MTWYQKILRGAINIVFILAFCAFLYASMRHVSTFYNNFEADGKDQTGSILLALALDVTALMLTVGIMAFGRTMPPKSKRIVWGFIFFLTGLSWFINWEYANHYQTHVLTNDPTLLTVNPVIASAFAALNLAYAYVSEFFTTKVKTLDELRAELQEKQERETLEAQLKGNKKGIIERAKNTVLDINKAVNEVQIERAKNVVKPEPKTDEIESTKAEVLPPGNDPKTGDFDRSKIASLEPALEDENGSEDEALTAVITVQEEPVKSDLDAVLAVYPAMAKYTSGDVKSISIDDLAAATKHGRQKIINRIKLGVLKTAPRNDQKVLLFSAFDWLKTEPKPRGDTDKMHVVRYVS